MQEKRYQSIKKLTENPFLNLYQMDARTKSGKAFGYFFASRNGEKDLKIKTHSLKPEGMAVYALRKEMPDQIVLLRQYRYPLDAYLYELPAGLVEAGETVEEAAVREMKEETGLTLSVYENGDEGARRPFYLAQGITDESGSMVYGFVTGEISKREQEDTEDIEVLFATKEEAKRILREERVSMRAGLMLLQFIRMEAGEPFVFLEW